MRPSPVVARPSAAPGRPPARKQEFWTVAVMTPVLAIAALIGVFALGQIFYPDDTLAAAEPTPMANDRTIRQPTPTVPVVVQPIDTARLNAGLIEKAPPFDWPEVDGLKLVPDTGRPGEHADYVPALADVETRRLIQASSVGVVLHSNPSLAHFAADELAKSYPLRATKQKVLDMTASTGYLPDESGFGVVFTAANYRVYVETIAASPPITDEQRDQIEYHTLHLADHLARRIQELASLGKRTGPEATAVHWRDHIVRQLPIGR